MAAIIATKIQPNTSKFLCFAKIVPETLQAKMPNISSQNINEAGSKRVTKSGVRASGFWVTALIAGSIEAVILEVAVTLKGVANNRSKG